MSSVLVLNYDFTPLNVTSFKRGFVLVCKGKAEVVKSDDNPLSNGYKNFVRPVIIRLLTYIKHYTKKISPTRNRIYKRDDNQCVYCGSKKQLTIDHILPKSRGGTNEWTNLVTCCFRCNIRKANRTPEEANMKMNKSPYVPQIMVENSNLTKIWVEYQNSFV
jgi:5-methylcytosine-specific restriction endonuclease McrA